jgi:hypothetical protein
MEDDAEEEDDLTEKGAKELNQKLKQLKIQLYKNAIQSEKKSACFWEPAAVGAAPSP